MCEMRQCTMSECFEDMSVWGTCLIQGEVRFVCHAITQERDVYKSVYTSVYKSVNKSEVP